MKNTIMFWDNVNSNDYSNNIDIIGIIQRNISDLELIKHKNILEVGCGVGCNLLELNKIFTNTFGCDISQVGITKCREKGLKNISHCNGDSLPYDSKKFSIVLLSKVISVQKNPISARKLCDEVDRVLNNNGFVFIIDFCFSSTNQYSKKGMYNYIESMNLQSTFIHYTKNQMLYFFEDFKEVNYEEISLKSINMNNYPGLVLILQKEKNMSEDKCLRVKKDIDNMFFSIKLEREKRYFKMRYWEIESREAEYAEKITGSIRLESVAEHSWHMCDIILLIYDNFKNDIDLSMALKLAIIHDKLEILTGDRSPLGRDGTGKKAHGFNEDMQRSKTKEELENLEYFIEKIPQEIKEEQRELFLDIIFERTKEAKFVKAVDKLQSIIFITDKKKGDLSDEYLQFVVNYSGKCKSKYPLIIDHYNEAIYRLLKSVSNFRKIDLECVYNIIKSNQMELF